MLVTLRLKGSDSKQVAAELARVTHEEVVFNQSTPGDVFSLDVKNAPLWNVLEILSARGKVRIAGEEFSHFQAIRNTLVSGGRLMVCVRRTTVKRLVAELAYLSGRNFRVTGGDGRAQINFTATNATLEEIVAQVEAEASVRISTE
jgi:hypothetical protein